MLHFILCDDNKLHLAEMVDLTRQWADDKKLEIEISQFNSGAALLEQFKPQRNDIVVLDIMLPFIDGITLARKLRNIRQDFHIIFLTSSKDFALTAYDVHPYAYLLKPLDYDEYSATLNSLMKKIQQHALVLHSGYETYHLPIAEISWVEAVNKQLVFNMADGRVVAVRETLTNIQNNLLQYPAFFKPHRSYIVNFNYVEHFNAKEIFMKNAKVSIPVARGMDKDFKAQYFDFMFSEQ